MMIDLRPINVISEIMRLGIDMDGCVINFHEKFVEVANTILDRQFTLEQALTTRNCEDGMGLTEKETRAVYGVVDSPGYAQTFNPYPHAVEVITDLYDKGHDIYFVTKQKLESPTWTSDRDIWLKEYFGEELGSRVVYTEHKNIIRLDALIEDTLSYADRFMKENLKCGSYADVWIHGQPYNTTTRYNRFHDWRDIPNYVLSHPHLLFIDV